MAYAKNLKKYGLVGLGLGAILIVGTMFNSQANNSENDKIHFIDVGNSNAVLIESNNKFALIDTGDNSDVNDDQYKKVSEYLKKNAINKDGKVELELVIATHPDKNAIGGLDELIEDENINIKQIVLENYEDATKRVRVLEDKENMEAYYNLTNSISKKNIFRITETKDLEYSVGDFKLEFINTLESKENISFLEDSNSSIVVKVTKDDKSALITGGLNNHYMDENRLAAEIGNVDLMILANQGDKTASTEPFLNSIKPKTAILSGENKKLNPITYNVLKNMKTKILSTEDNGDIVAIFKEDSIDVNKDKQIKSGWYQDEHKTYYYNEEGKFLTGWQNINNNTYLFNEDGTLRTGWIKDTANNIYYANTDGKISKGVTNISSADKEDKLYYFNEQGILTVGWVQDGDKWYYFDENIETENYASAVKGMIELPYNNANRTFMFDEKGVMKTGLVQIDGKEYYFNDNPEIGVVGEMLKGVHTLTINDVNAQYDFGADGVLKR